MDQFTRSYIKCALWASADEFGDPLDDNYGVEDIDTLTLAGMIVDCKRFQDENAYDIATYPGECHSPEDMAGHDFWLTRNGQGFGFFDGDWPEAGARLMAASEAFGECILYIENGKIYSD